MIRQEYLYQEYPKWVRGVDQNGVEVDLIVETAEDEAAQKERVEALQAAQAQAEKGKGKGKAESAA